MSWGVFSCQDKSYLANENMLNMGDERDTNVVPEARIPDWVLKKPLPDGFSSFDLI